MLQKFVIYFSLKESGDVLFSPIYSSFNHAKDSMNSFLEDYFKRMGKKVFFVTKEEFEKNKKPENGFYVRKKNSEAVIYRSIVSVGTFYNTYSMEKYGKLGINEFLIPKDNSDLVINNDKIKDLYVTNQERGTHISFLSELKNTIAKRENVNNIQIQKQEKKEKDRMDIFIDALLEGKNKLKTASSEISSEISSEALSPSSTSSSPSSSSPSTHA